MSPSTLLCALSIVAIIHAAPCGTAFADDAKQHIPLASGVSMAYRVAGPVEAPALILLHGLGDTSRSWSLLLPELAKTNRVYALDLRGHGGTTAPACCYALADFGYDVISFMGAMKIESAVVAGHSLGSFIAQHLATTYPARVRALILLGSADTTLGNELVEWLRAQTLTFNMAVTPAFVDEWQSNPTPVEPEFLANVKRETLAVPVQVWKSVARTLLTEESRRFLTEFKAPTLILWGEKDAAFLQSTRSR